MTDITQNWTAATIIISASDQQPMQTLLGDPSLFIALASPTGQLPASNAFTSGPWDNALLDRMTAKDFPYSMKVRTADWQAALAGEGLQMIVPQPIANPV